MRLEQYITTTYRKFSREILDEFIRVSGHLPSLAAVDVFERKLAGWMYSKKLQYSYKSVPTRRKHTMTDRWETVVYFAKLGKSRKELSDRERKCLSYIIRTDRNKRAELKKIAPSDWFGRLASARTLHKGRKGKYHHLRKVTRNGVDKWYVQIMDKCKRYLSPCLDKNDAIIWRDNKMRELKILDK